MLLNKDSSKTRVNKKSTMDKNKAKTSNNYQFEDLHFTYYW